MRTKRILGIDPALSKTGWGVLESVNNALVYINCGSFKTDINQSLAERLLEIFHNIKKIILEYSPAYVAIEETYVNNNAKTSLHLAHARASIIVAAAELGHLPEFYQAKTIKKTLTGNGNADKAQVLKMLQIRLKGFSNSNDKDAVDALAIAFCHSHHS